MPLNKRPGLVDNLTNYVEGYLNSTNYEDPAIQTPAASPFVRMVVLDVVFDPHNDLLDETKKGYWQSLGIVNFEWANTLPRNTIIAKKVGEESSPFFAFPFFPSHLALPCKPGEFVWAMFEDGNNLSASGLRVYWFCRITEPHTVDDVNHTHAPRVFEPTLFPSTKDISESIETIHELRNGAVVGENRETSDEVKPLPGEDEDIFERLVLDSDAAKLMSYESIPRYRKRPGDIVLEGTNNTLIVLGTDRKREVASYVESTSKEDIVRRTLIANLPDGDFISSAGAIDLVAGRGQIEGDLGTSGKIASTIALKNGLNDGKEIKKELNKTLTELSRQEGNPDLTNDRSRILISQRTKVDNNFQLSAFNETDLDVKDSETGDAAIVIKSDKVRIIARSDLQLLVTNFIEENSASDVKIKKDSASLTEWASVTIKSNGDIIFKPSDKGYIKLGDDDADKAILCTDKPAIKAEGTVSYTPGLLTTGASVVGTGQSGQGTFAKKVLVK